MPLRPQIDGDDTPDDETLRFEGLVLRRTVGSVASGLTDLVTAILAAFAGAVEQNGGPLSDTQAREFGRLIAERLEASAWAEMTPSLRAAALDAHRFGVERAARRFHDAGDRAKAAGTKTPERRRTPDPDRALREELRRAARIARAGIRTQADAASVAGKVKQGKARIEGHARSVANEGINAGTADVARTMELRLMWVAERNACLDCLAHAGHAVEPGQRFPGVSFDPKAKPPAVEWPPLHPNCRCQVRTFDGPAGPPPSDRSSLSPAARLAAEARRSVVYQWTDYESGPAARRAAEALLAAGAGLPASVEARARRALKKKK